MPGLFKKVILLLLVTIIFSCSDKPAEDDTITIAVTISPYKNLIEKIAGKEFKIISSIPEGATPHHFEPTPKLIQSVANADYYFSVGKYMEFEDVWLQKITGINSSIKVIDLSEGVNFINSDPHIWLSPSRLTIICGNILTTLNKIAPGKQEIFTENYQIILDSLGNIREELTTVLSEIDNRILLTYHGSWEYFCEDFNFRQISIEKGSKTSSAKEFKIILDIVKKTNVPVIFIDPQHSKASAEVIADDLGIPIGVLNPLASDVFKNFHEMKKTILRYYK